MPERGVSGVTLNQFFTAVLKGLGAPVTATNLAKLGAVARLEGHGGDYNPFNYVLGPGTNFNSVGVKNYPDINTGIAQTIKLLSQRNTTAMRNSLMSDGTYDGWLTATSNFYNSWGGPDVRTTQNNATTYLNNIVDGPSVPLAQRSSLGSTTGTVTTEYSAGPPEDPLNWQSIRRWQDQQESAFNRWLSTQPAERQQQIINELNTDRDLSALGQYMQSAPYEVNAYLKYLSQLPAEAMEGAKAKLAVQPTSATATGGGAVSDAPQPSPELTNLLQTFGVSYPNAPQPTPALLAYLRGIGLNLSTAEDVKRRAIERIGAATTDAMADIDRTAGRTKQNVTADLVRRGVLSSGEANTRYTRHAEDVAAAQSDVQRKSAEGKEEAEVGYAAARDAARQQALDRVISAETEQAQQTAASKAQEEAYKRQQEASDLAWQRQQTTQDESLRRQEELIRQYGAQGVTV